MKLLYRGASLLDRAPVLVAMTENSDNRKTGPMDQLWILRADRHPYGAVKDGLDTAICGDCFHRGTATRARTCYVNVQHAPAAIFRAFAAGRYEDLTMASMPRVSWAMRHRLLRIGAYGDPAAVPVEWWRALVRRARGWTAYTHHWRTCDPLMREIAMASVDSMAEQREAEDRGYRTYRVGTSDAGPLPSEAQCPASDEMGHQTTCAKCLLCNGKELGDTRRHITIQIHKTPAAFHRSRQGELFSL